MLVKPPCTTAPGVCEGNSTTIATTPSPSRISTKVPRNSAINSADRGNLPLINRLLEFGPQGHRDSSPPASAAGRVHGVVSFPHPVQRYQRAHPERSREVS